MRIGDLVREVVRVSEKAALLARTVRAEQALFKLLVQEKTGEEKNKRFLEDFKTLADVLVQETISHDLEKKFPALAGHIRGEESNKFTNVLGETVIVKVMPTAEETAHLLDKVLDGNHTAATLLAKVVHQDVTMEISLDQSELDAEIPDDSVGMWIDPIDSTAQYIHGLDSVQHVTGVHKQGLQSVLVLIGVYDRTSGTPVLGVVNQPFTTRNPTSDSWIGSHWWGVSYDGLCEHSMIQSSPPTPHSEQHVVISASETPAFCDSFSTEYSPIKASGGGYKLLCVVEHLVSAFILSHASCFKWDTCGPHAILRALGGGVLDLQKALAVLRKHTDQPAEEVQLLLKEQAQLVYHQPDQLEGSPGQLWANTGGLLAYRDINVALNLLHRVAKQ